MKGLPRKLKTRLLTLGVAIVFCAVALSPLSPEAEIKTRLMVDSIGIDANAEGIKIACETVVSGSNEVVSGKGATLSEAMENLNLRYGRDIELEHCGLVVVGEDTTKDALVSILLSILSDASINAGCSIVSAKGSAEDFMNDAVKITKSAGDGITGFITYTDQQSTVMVPSILEVIQDLTSKSAATILPIVGFEKKEGGKGEADSIGQGEGSSNSSSSSGSSGGSEETEIVPITTVMAISDNGLKVLDEQFTRGLVWTQPRSKGGLIDCECEIKDKVYTIRSSVEKSKFSIKAEFKDKPVITMKANAQLKFVDRYSIIAATEDRTSFNTIVDKIEEAYKKAMYEDISLLAEESRVDDILGFKTHLYRKEPKRYNEWSKNLFEVEFVFDIKVEVI